MYEWMDACLSLRGVEKGKSKIFFWPKLHVLHKYRGWSVQSVSHPSASPLEKKPQPQPNEEQGGPHSRLWLGLFNYVFMCDMSVYTAVTICTTI
jgi:hypothetical protein